jgi:hypothetical protein
MHGTLDWRLIEPKPYLAYCPCLVPQSTLKEKLHVLDAQGNVSLVEETGCSSEFREVDRHSNYDTENACILSKFGPTVRARLGDVVLARSGDKGSNLNVGFAVREADEWEWLRSFLSRKALQELMAEEYDESYKLERCELQGIKAVHFVIFGILSRGVSSSSRLDALGKGFAEFIRDRWIDMPEQFLKRYENILPASHGEISSGSQRE